MALLLDLSAIRDAREHIDRRLPAAALQSDEDEFRVVTDVALSCDVERHGRRVDLAGSIHAALELPCSRCLEPMPWSVDATVDLRYLPASQNAGDGEQEVGDEDLGVAFYEGEAIDLGQLVREQFYLSLPMKPLCRPDCQGLCPECGVNRNTTRCGCEHRWTDPRLDALKALLPKGSTEH
jgi:uncharacterized protein